MQKILFVRWGQLASCLALALSSTVATSQPQADDQALLSTYKTAAPPRSIDDVVKLLEASKPDAAFVKKNQDLVNATPPANGTDEELWSFYKRRAKAADH